MQEVERDPVRLVLEPAVAKAVAGDVAAAVADRLCGGGPDLARRLVADVERLAGGVGHRVVRPRCQLVLATVLRPGVTAALGRDLKAEAGIGDDVDPRGWRTRDAIEDGDVFQPVPVEAARAVEELELRRGSRRSRTGGVPCRTWPRRRRHWREQRQMLGDVAPRRGEADTRDGGQQRSRLRCHRVRSQHVGRSLGDLSTEARARLAAAYRGLDRRLQVLNVGRRVLVDDDEIDGKPLHPPVLVRAQKLTNLRDVADVADPQQHDREVAGDPVPPEIRLRSRAFQYGGLRGAEAGIGVDDGRREALEIRRLLRPDVEMA